MKPESGQNMGPLTENSCVPRLRLSLPSPSVFSPSEGLSFSLAGQSFNSFFSICSTVTGGQNDASACFGSAVAAPAS